MEAFLSACFVWEGVGRRDRWTNLPKRHNAMVEPLDQYEVLDSEEEFACRGASWDQLCEELAKSGRFTLAKLCCGGDSSSDEEDLGRWVNGWVRGSPILDPEWIMYPHIVKQTVRGLPIGHAEVQAGGATVRRRKRRGDSRLSGIPPAHQPPGKSETPSSAPQLRQVSGSPSKEYPGPASLPSGGLARGKRRHGYWISCPDGRRSSAPKTWLPTPDRTRGPSARRREKRGETVHPHNATTCNNSCLATHRSLLRGKASNMWGGRALP